ncbi:hypothetical protein KDL01_39560 [Actinospica durhamensis]|uniref:Secreted protein n=1 Tax=Actinospica durhamensis TaxID=1508375 RepID=A0A941F0N9_9ACTN|nr:hypothetical protein [Actinospica durhamensis]MBR7839424.1 hypothetical protein [Actinospica durhamensis]
MKSTAHRRNHHIKVATAATLVLAAIGATAGCASQTTPTSDTASAASSAAPTSTLQTPTAQPTTAPATSTTSAASTSPAAGTSLATTNSQSVKVAIEDCGTGAALTRPAALVLACADQGAWAKNLTWSSWTATKATATGTLTWHVCTPNCAESTKWDSTSAEVILTDPVAEPGNKVLFTKLELRVTGPTPAGYMRDVTYNMAPQ